VVYSISDRTARSGAANKCLASYRMQPGVDSHLAIRYFRMRLSGVIRRRYLKEIAVFARAREMVVEVAVGESDRKAFEL
ncbi:MAG: hypothetical protein XD88_1807, partial [Methanocalculus sp. 52_23]